jgi:hypothetical protein
LSATFPDDKKANVVVVRIPMPPTAATAKITVSKGRAKYEPGKYIFTFSIYR